MENENGEEKTEEPTAKKIEDSRNEGQVAQSKEVTSIGVLLGAFIALYIYLRQLTDAIMDFYRHVLDRFGRSMEVGDIYDLILSGMEIVLWPLFPILGAVVLFGAAAQLSQVGWNLSAKSMEPKLEKLNPISGVKRIISLKGCMELLKGILKLLIVSALLYSTIEKEITTLVLVAHEGIHASVKVLGDIVWVFIAKALVIFTLMAALDYLYQSYEMTKQLKMTKQEVKDESKSREGDMQNKARLRGMARQLLTRTGVNNVGDADVVITNPSHFAVAIKYRQGEMDAPIVIARGADRIAKMIKDEARRSGIPRIENRALARALYAKARVGDTIPVELFNAVAEVLAHIYRIRKRSA